MQLQENFSNRSESAPPFQFCEEMHEILKPYLHLKTIKKNEVLLQENQTCKNLYFIIEGAVKEYSIDKEGKEFILHFYFESNMACQFDSFLSQKPSPTYLEALEGSKFWVLSYHDFKKVCEQMPHFSERIAACIAKTTAKRMSLLLACDAMTRYEIFMEQESQVLLRIPHYMIASYLGIAPETLSRIRRKMSMKVA
jgi:CRP-like cAMP-binding protein